jgi:hypothetical protein
VRVTHYSLNTPCLEFLGRDCPKGSAKGDRSISDLVGEKLHAEFVSEALKELALEEASFQCLVPATTPQAHYILLLDRVNAPASAIIQQLEQFLHQFS